MTDHLAYPHDHPDDATMVRYLSGASDSAERARIERWLAADEAHRAELAALRAAWDPAPVADADPNDQMWRWISARMEEPMPRPRLLPEEPRSSRTVSALRKIALLAAAIVLVVGGALFVMLPGRSARDGAGVALSGSNVRELVAPRGARVTGNLPDGSRFVLAPDTRLLIPNAFAVAPGVRGTRDVYLEHGEAFFEVTHDSTRPFRVHTANGVAEDLGTEFVVTAYPEMRATRVVVASGVVALRGLRGDTAETTLHAGDLGRIDASGVRTMRNVDLSSYVGLKNGELVLDEVPLEEAVTTLGRWYDIDIRLADPAMARRHFSSTFRNESVAQVLRVLEVALDVRAERAGSLVILRPRP